MSINDFKDRGKEGVDQATWDEYEDYKRVNHEDTKYNDAKYGWKIVYLKGTDIKYGRMAVSEEYQLSRGLTMGEFYGSGVVD